MGKYATFDHDKSYQRIALQSFEELYAALTEVHRVDGQPPQVDIIIRGKKGGDKRITLPNEQIGEIIDVLRLSMGYNS